MRKGELQGVIDLDTLKNKSHLYGLGPVEYLKGEITLMDGKIYVATISKSGELEVSEEAKVKAPFFVHTKVDRWKKLTVPSSVKSMEHLDAFLTGYVSAFPSYAFRFISTVEEADFHVVNLPEGTQVASSEDAHKGKQSFTIRNTNIEAVGFFSKDHKGIFTHHDSNLHVHIITSDKKQMGHLDAVHFKSGTLDLWVADK